MGRIGKPEEIAKAVLSCHPTIPGSSPALSCTSTAAQRMSLPRGDQILRY
jgi:hypothetical protein